MALELESSTEVPVKINKFCQRAELTNFAVADRSFGPGDRYPRNCDELCMVTRLSRGMSRLFQDGRQFWPIHDTCPHLYHYQCALVRDELGVGHQE